MKGISTRVAGTIAIASLAAANPAPTPVQVEARAASGTATSLPTVTVSGNAFWAGSSRFYIRGLDYQPGGSSDAADPLADKSICGRDIPYFQKLGINTIRVYTVDNSANHDDCMNALAAAGIYVALDVNTPKYSINRDNPGPSYNPTYLQSIFATMEEFSKYTNTLLFFNGNEVINNPNNTNTAPYVKAVGRDMKTYRVSRGLRPIPIGYSAADVDTNRYQTALYFNCGTDDERSDFFAFNDYSLCDPDSYTGSQWAQKVQQYGNYSLPLFMSEYGCIQNKRTFSYVKNIYSDMTPVYSGGMVYEYSEEGNNYGLVTISGSSVQTNDQFAALATQLSQNPAPTGNGGAKTASVTANACPTDSSEWQLTAFSSDSLPALPSGAAKFMSQGAGTGPGLKGDGSQDAPGGSSATATPGSGSATAQVSGASATSSKGAASSMHSAVPMGYSGVWTVGIVVMSSLFGALLL
ncbi:glycoside hydrolase family 72 protein [Myriangium duriaei CBS 260.36]|uniref:1,3-beta-glucanosyltransferase n=1 Tax=Myriangium duriaei CBS 260.36 TaxID=1168546 RepID=A0A9P4IZ29_9PEZI|nr:glycoside hydrolase family 72 protein [Myriangium duriaei CBS 260.36]